VPLVAALPQPLIRPPVGQPPLNPAPVVGGRAPLARFMRSSAGWTASISLPEPALDLSWRIGEAGEFVSTGQSDTIDQRTGERMPTLSFPLPANAPSEIIQLRYRTPDRGVVGPFAILFDPDVELYRETKRNLESIPSAWVQFATGDTPIVYFTLLVTYRCAISQVLYGLDDAKPLARFEMPACNAKDPFAISASTATYLRVPPATRAISVQIVWRDGTQSQTLRVARD
jgi:hypothetical protein